MQLLVVERANVTCPAAKLTLSRRIETQSNYRLPVADMISKVQWTLDQAAPTERTADIDLTVLCSAQRAFGTICTRANATIIFDLGFVELISDFLAVWYGIPDEIALTPALVTQLAAPFPAFTSKEQNDCRDMLFALLLDQEWSSSTPQTEFKQSAEADEPAYAEDDGDLTVTGSQLFRDFAAKLCDVRDFPPDRRRLFDAAMLWMVDLDGSVYRPGDLVFNYLLQDGAANSAADNRSAAFIASVAEAVSLVTLHEVAHVLFDRDKLALWKKGREHAEIMARARWLGIHGGADLARVIGLLDTTEPDRMTRIRRAIDESFFDIRALAMTIGAIQMPLNIDAVERSLSFLLNLKCANIALMIFKDHMIATIDEPQHRTDIGAAAQDETILRCVMVFSYLISLLDHHFPGRKHRGMQDALTGILGQINMLYKFFTIDMMNGLPIWSSEDESFDDEATRIWVRLVELMTRSAPLSPDPPPPAAE